MQDIAETSCNEIHNLINTIKVFAFDGEDVTVENPTELYMIGKGRHGAVFELNPNACVKIFGEEDVCARELYALTLGQHTTLIPKIFCHGPNFIVMEMVKGVDLREYLQSQPLTKQISANLVQLLSTFKEIGYERIDHHKRHIFVQEDGNFKVLDVGTTVWRNRVYPYPRKLLNSLGEDYKVIFLEHVKEFNPELYADWQQYMEMEKFAASLHKSFFSNEKVKVRNIKTASNNLITNAPEWEAKIEDLVRKVHKEEWIKGLAIRGFDPVQMKGIVGIIEDEYTQAKKVVMEQNAPAPIEKIKAPPAENKEIQTDNKKKKVRVFTSKSKSKKSR